MPRVKPNKAQVVQSEDHVIVYGVPRPCSPLETATTTPTAAKRKLELFNGPGQFLMTSSEPSLGERLQKDLGAAEEVVDPGPPKADSMSVLLEQGLKSGDISLLQSVLNRNDEQLIRKTIELLPLQYTIPLIQHLGKMCADDRARPNKAPLLWLSNALTIRSSYLTTLPNLSESLRNLYVHADRRIRHTDRFVRLAGTISASVNLVKQRMLQKAAAISQRSVILSYNEPLDETDSDDDDTGDTDEEMPSDERSDEDSKDEDEFKRKKPLGEKDADNDSDSDVPQKEVNGKHTVKNNMESDDDA